MQHDPATFIRRRRLELSRRRVLQIGVGGIASIAGGRSILAATHNPVDHFPTTWRFGDVTITKVLDGVGTYDAAKAYPGAPLDAFVENAEWLVPHFYDPKEKALIFAYQSYVVRTPHKTMIVDCGMGNDKDRTILAEMNQRHGPYLANLHAAGVKPESVDYVMSTHFHSDHTGWNTRLENGKWVPTFPKARYLFNKPELSAVQSRLSASAPVAAAYNDSLLPILEAGRADIFEGDWDLGDGVRIVQTPGHTAGHIAIAVNSHGHRAIMAGDILHNPIEVLHPEWTVFFDDDKQAGMAQRTKFIEAHTDVDVTIFAAHFGGPTAGHIVGEKGGRRRFRTLVA